MSHLSSIGASCCIPVPLMGGFLCHCDDAGLTVLHSHPDVESVEDDVHVQLVVARDRRTARRNHEIIPDGVWRVRAPQAWGITRGQGVRIAIIDTGIDVQHPDLAGNVAGGINFVNPGTLPRDDNGHGTHVAGTVGALHNSLGVAGVAPEVRLYAVKVLDARGSGKLSNVILGLQWAIDHGMHVANLSLGLSANVKALETVVRKAAAAGMVLVAAAGNHGYPNSVVYPAKYPDVVAVSAVDTNGELASFSSTGPQINVAAPGVRILSTLPGRRYGTMSGTSMACPHVTGAVAIGLSRVPDATASEVHQMIASNSMPLSGLSREEQGSGMIDAFNMAKFVIQVSGSEESTPREANLDL